VIILTFNCVVMKLLVKDQMYASV